MKKTTTCLLLLVAAMTASADVKQTVAIGGSVVNQTVKTITFDGAIASVVFANASSQTTDIEGLSIHFDYDGEGTSISTVQNQGEDKRRTGVYNLKGQRVADNPDQLGKGIYIINGKKAVVR